MTENIIEVQDLTKDFVEGGIVDRLLGTDRTIHAVDKISFSLSENESLALIGESGSGKSTVAKILVGIYSATSGEVLFKGEQLNQDSIGKMPIQLIFQDAGESLNPKKTVRNIISRPLEREPDLDRKIDDLLTKVGLSPDMKNRYPTSFSGGQKQRIAIARALASDPEVLIADEPASGLDVSVQAKIINLLDDLTKEMGLSLLLISHNLGVVRTIADRVHIMYMGQIVEKGLTEDVFTKPAHPYTRALLSSILVPDPTVTSNRIQLSGELPSPENPPNGCRFHPRCPQALEGTCEVIEPEFHESSKNMEWNVVGEGHQSACHKHTEQSDQFKMKEKEKMEKEEAGEL